MYKFKNISFEKSKVLESEFYGTLLESVHFTFSKCRKNNLPIPKKHPDQRHLERIALRNPRKLFDRKCDKCSIEMRSTYPPERDKIVYCEKCYEKEIY
ncbi:MAG: hypothetical protein Q9M97_07585 [Candidatus Gracilibacteria bacterium]|nr:hypothetical protein [Candidatus Gracilibacteria bacterium]